MRTTMFSRLTVGLSVCLLLVLGGCEQPEEPLTPPASLEQAAKKPPRNETPDNAPGTAPAPTTEQELTGESAEDAPPVLTAEDLEAVESGDMPDDMPGSTEGDEATESAEDAAEENAATTEDAGQDPSGEDSASTAEPVTLFPPELLNKASANICFFSFNTGSEYYQLKRMVQRLNETSAAQIDVTEYQLLDEDPYDSFVALLESGKQCDGIVLSGHHTDEFYGERSGGDLEVEDLEELACNPKYASWFGNIKALWLQGCNTAHATFHNEEADEDERITGSPIAPMLARLDADEMEDSVEDMYDLLEENINWENMVNHYMRVFSGATVYGWSFKAPGEQAGAQKSIPYHIAQISRLVDKNPDYFQNPLQTRIPDTAARRYSEVLYAVLKRPNQAGGAFPSKLNENTFIQGWRDHGNYRYKFAFDNHDIEAFPALINSNNEVLRQLKGLTCLMQQLDDRLDDMSMLEVADYILRDRNLTNYNSYLLWAMLRHSPEGSPEHQQLQKRLSGDDHLIRQLRQASRRGGYSPQDASAFLAMLNPPAEKKAEPPAVAKQPKAKPAAASKEKTATTEKAASTVPSESASAKPDANSQDQEPWYLNEEVAPVNPKQDDEQSFEFKAER